MKKIKIKELKEIPIERGRVTEEMFVMRMKEMRIKINELIEAVKKLSNKEE